MDSIVSADEYSLQFGFDSSCNAEKAAADLEARGFRTELVWLSH
jgi:hypothetical protein